MKTQRTTVYIDGFNLYFGLRSKGWRRYYWLNLWKLSCCLKQTDQQLMKVIYFTSRIRTPQDKRSRQNAYLRALGMTDGIERIYGKYIDEPHTCPKCNEEFSEPAEKMTDVQLSSHLLVDAFKDNYDTAIIVSEDSDLVPAIELCKTEFNNKRIIVAFPPMRHCEDLKNVAHGFVHITEKELKNSVFPQQVSDNVGSIVICPPDWV